jgi:SAM-dependent methyltransferase
MGVDRKPVSAPAFWEGLYAQGEDGWELREPGPPLVAWLDAGGLLGAPGARVAVPGCGRGHDARLLARRGYRAVGFDFAEAAVAEARALSATEGVDAAFEQRDIFTLPADHHGAFDAAWEYTCFCAIDPARRAEYVEVLRAILRPGGTLLGCFYPLREGTDGPPFPVGLGEVERLLAPGFRIVESTAPAASVERRRGLEWLIRATRV